MDRRTFLRIAAASALASTSIPLPSWCNDERSTVVIVTDNNFEKSAGPDPARIGAVLDLAIRRLTGSEDARDAWRSLFLPEDVVGIKVNCLAGRGISSHPELVEAIARSLQSIGIPGDQIIVWDRNNRDLRLAGFSIEKRGSLYCCFGTEEVGFDGRLYERGSIGSLFSTIQTRLCSAIINVPVLKDHGITGVSIALKNYYGAINNPNKYHPDGGNPYIADLNSMSIIRNKERLVICDSLRAQFHGGPAYAPAWNWKEGSIMVSRDPVALDSVGTRLIEEKRRERGLASLREEKRFPEYILTAARKNHLGVAGEGEIDLIREEV